jgi:hypothetical protein
VAQPATPDPRISSRSCGAAEVVVVEVVREVGEVEVVLAAATVVEDELKHLTSPT